MRLTDYLYRYMMYHDIDSEFGVGIDGDFVTKAAERVRKKFQSSDNGPLLHQSSDQQVCEHLMSHDVYKNPDVETFFDFQTNKCWLSVVFPRFPRFLF